MVGPTLVLARKTFLFTLTAILLVALGAAIFFAAITTPIQMFPSDVQPARTFGLFSYIGGGLMILGLCFGLMGVFSYQPKNSIQPHV